MRATITIGAVAASLVGCGYDVPLVDDLGCERDVTPLALDEAASNGMSGEDALRSRSRGSTKCT